MQKAKQKTNAIKQKHPKKQNEKTTQPPIHKKQNKSECEKSKNKTNQHKKSQNAKSQQKI